MLAIRLQRTGRKGHAMFRMIVQDSRWSPKSGKVVARLGSFDPHAKVLTVDKDKASFYLKNGAQPSVRTALLLKKDGVKLPSWVDLPAKRSSDVKNPDKLRRNQPNEPAVAEETNEAAPTDAGESATVDDASDTENATEQTPSSDDESPAADSTTDKKTNDETRPEEQASGK